MNAALKRVNFAVLWIAALIMTSPAWLVGLQFEKSEYAARRQKLMERISDGAAVILGAPSGNQSHDFYYLTGVEVPDAVLFVDAKKKESVIFYTISERAAREAGLSLDFVRDPVGTTGVERWLPAEQFNNFLAQRFYSYLYRQKSAREQEIATLYTPFKPGSIGELTGNLRQMTRNSWDGRVSREVMFARHLQDEFPQLNVKDCTEIIWELRLIKSPAEVEVMRKTARIRVKALLETMKSTRPGMREYELAGLFGFLSKKEGAQDPVFQPIISSGENHEFVHYNKNDRLLEDGDFIVFDGGPAYGYYHTDISISFPVNGKFSPRQRDMYEACLAVSKACLSIYRPGLTCMDVGEQAHDVLKKKGYDLSKDVFQKLRFFNEGGCTHPVGLDGHDAGGADLDYCGTLKPGMVFACDVFATYPAEKLGVRVENTVLITEKGCENLTVFPREISEIEALMKTKGIIQLIKEAGLYDLK